MTCGSIDTVSHDERLPCEMSDDAASGATPQSSLTYASQTQAGNGDDGVVVTGSRRVTRTRDEERQRNKDM